MPGIVIVGAQWGDEGKGKVVDLLAEQADAVIRFQGGNNAGHTIVREGETRIAGGPMSSAGGLARTSPLPSRFRS